MNSSVNVTRKQAAQILAATFPEYSGRTIKVEFTQTVSFWDTNWGGGTKNTYKVLGSDMTAKTVPAPAPWFNVIEGKSVELPTSHLIVEHSVFCGQDLGITIYAHPSYSPKWLNS